MPESEGVPEFVHRLFYQALTEQRLARGEAVKALVQPLGGHDGAPSSDLRFSEHEGQDGNEKIEPSNSDRPYLLVAFQISDPPQQLGCVILAAPGIESEISLESRFRQHMARQPEDACQRRRQVVEKSDPDTWPHRYDMDRPRHIYFSPYRRSRL